MIKDRSRNRTLNCDPTGWRRALILCFAICCATCAPLFGQNGADSFGTSSAVHFASSIDWEKGEITIELSRSLPESGRNLPAAGFAAEVAMKQALPDEIGRALLPLQVDSLHSVADLVQSTPELYRTFQSLSPEVQEGFPVYSSDLRTITIPYTLPLYPAVASLLVHHSQPSPLDTTLQWVPTNKFTGVVIYARGKLPLHGTGQTADLVPSLFPTLYDTSMRQIVGKLRMDPSYLKRWGAAAYTTGFSETPYIGRIGLSPLRIVATEFFGETPTDIIISDKDANALLSTDNNRSLLVEGRILIIYGHN